MQPENKEVILKSEFVYLRQTRLCKCALSSALDASLASHAGQTGLD